ncbi:uncharacterized protein LOC132303145 [Cornus florida]|uniref:uncharacterized protein LOC132303145 n=1 Tax=Cornus florida TaxID=4283 RepID=UPI0028A1980F|nr:uncharacterized protein LOC132303145 [Cornus florida]XP_059656254.1 uncharacterized protein LOC132303145 [Cornus florida]XP_059656255.1 uncharacterized protein LOC132303145 [Cornus florida]
MSKHWTISPIRKKWRGYKCELKSEYYSVMDTDAERFANPPPDVEKEHWEFLVRHWGMPMAKEVNKKNKERRGKQTMIHTTETKCFARVSAEIEEDEGIQLSRADLFIRTHINKDGKATDAASLEMIENITELQKSYSDSPICSSNDLFSIVRGEERTGRVRMLGFKPTPRDVWGPSFSKAELINNVKKSQEEARVELQEAISKMQADYDNKLENLRANYDDKLENLQQLVTMLMQMQQQN